ncbi:hypothetical protein [Vibrio kanaloae]|uniref:hypothetical protein n=1 Tax=Vibrio kanaloae TaxID=170673 RepID=UPI0009898489|nr:hypothetical protein [Vibrio kanaloae]QPK04261.1 hypothetical protein BTD91_13625 [Vibrio kanaloae]
MVTDSVKTESRLAYDNFRIATNCLEFARRSSEDWEVEHHSITGIAFVAFSIEAMLNHYGRILLKDWDEKRESRKESHKRLFKAANLPSYLGGNEYRLAKQCFYLRDLLAHGKTKHETVDLDLPDGLDDRAKLAHMLKVRTEPFRCANYQLLKTFIEATRKIEKDIEENGYYPNQDHIEACLREKLQEAPLSVSGVRYI